MKTLLAVSLIANVILALSVVRLENASYATSLGLCSEFQQPSSQFENCLWKVQTRTNSFWHIYYATKETIKTLVSG